MSAVIRTVSVIGLCAAAIATSMSAARADSVPILQVGPSCEAAGRGSVVLGRSKEACLADESTAQESLKKNWPTYSGIDKQQCIGMAKTGGPGSYVELLSCLEIRRDAHNIKDGDPLENDPRAASIHRNRR
jgi:hypothetical protein